MALLASKGPRPPSLDERSSRRPPERSSEAHATHVKSYSKYFWPFVNNTRVLALTAHHPLSNQTIFSRYIINENNTSFVCLPKLHVYFYLIMSSCYTKLWCLLIKLLDLRYYYPFKNLVTRIQEWRDCHQSFYIKIPPKVIRFVLYYC